MFRTDAVLVLEACDYETFPPGGQLSFARQLVKVFGDRLALVGLVHRGEPVGRWFERDVDGHRCPFLGIRQVDPSEVGRPLVPARVSAYLALKRHIAAIRSSGLRSVFTQSPECLLAISSQEWASVCFRFPGVTNALSISRYRWARQLAGLYERRLFRALQRADVVLASADERAIRTLVTNSRGLLAESRVRTFPTRVDTVVFRPRNRTESRIATGLDLDATVLVASGRLNRVKGWDLLLEALALARRDRPDLQLVFVGDGEDRPALVARTASLGLGPAVILAGEQPPERVAQYLGAADLFVVGSHVEGWSNAMLEAFASGLWVVSTDVSGARDMVDPGRNGYVVPSRDPADFAGALLMALGNARSPVASIDVARRYSLENLARDLGEVWAPLGTRP